MKYTINLHDINKVVSEEPIFSCVMINEAFGLIEHNIVDEFFKYGYKFDGKKHYLTYAPYIEAQKIDIPEVDRSKELRDMVTDNVNGCLEITLSNGVKFRVKTVNNTISVMKTNDPFDRPSLYIKPITANVIELS